MRVIHKDSSHSSMIDDILKNMMIKQDPQKSKQDLRLTSFSNFLEGKFVLETRNQRASVVTMNAENFCNSTCLEKKIIHVLGFWTESEDMHCRNWYFRKYSILLQLKAWSWCTTLVGSWTTFQSLHVDTMLKPSARPWQCLNTITSRTRHSTTTPTG